MNGMHIVLGSQSPRRRELLAGLDIPFDCVVIDADESFPAGLQGGGIPAFISRAKAQAYLGRLRDDDLLITADTIVWLPPCDGGNEGLMLGKPKDDADACRMLRLLSGRTHQVFTGVTFASADTMETVVDATDVTFRALDDAEISRYVTRYRPLDKAGAYGVQEWIGYIGVTAIRGSYFNVMGLPVERVYEFLRAKGAWER